MDVITCVVIAAVTMLFGSMAVAPLLVESVPVRRKRPESMSIVVRNDEREPARVA
jgi:hypothetical protein